MCVSIEKQTTKITGEPVYCLRSPGCPVELVARLNDVYISASDSYRIATGISGISSAISECGPTAPFRV